MTIDKPPTDSYKQKAATACVQRNQGDEAQLGSGAHTMLAATSFSNSFLAFLLRWPRLTSYQQPPKKPNRFKELPKSPRTEAHELDWARCPTPKQSLWTEGGWSGSARLTGPLGISIHCMCSRSPQETVHQRQIKIWSLEERGTNVGQTESGAHYSTSTSSQSQI